PPSAPRLPEAWSANALLRQARIVPMRTPVPLRPLAYADYLTMREGARVMEADRHGDKVLHLPDGTYFKLFRRKRRISSAAWYPYVRRFADNTLALQRLGIPCPRVIALYRIA